MVYVYKAFGDKIAELSENKTQKARFQEWRIIDEGEVKSTKDNTYRCICGREEPLKTYNTYVNMINGKRIIVGSKCNNHFNKEIIQQMSGPQNKLKFYYNKAGIDKKTGVIINEEMEDFIEKDEEEEDDDSDYVPSQKSSEDENDENSIEQTIKNKKIVIKDDDDVDESMEEKKPKKYTFPIKQLEISNQSKHKIPVLYSLDDIDIDFTEYAMNTVEWIRLLIAKDKELKITTKSQFTSLYTRFNTFLSNQQLNDDEYICTVHFNDPEAYNLKCKLKHHELLNYPIEKSAKLFKADTLIYYWNKFIFIYGYDNNNNNKKVITKPKDTDSMEDESEEKEIKKYIFPIERLKLSTTSSDIPTLYLPDSPTNQYVLNTIEWIGLLCNQTKELKLIKKPQLQLLYDRFDDYLDDVVMDEDDNNGYICTIYFNDLEATSLQLLLYGHKLISSTKEYAKLLSLDELISHWNKFINDEQNLIVIVKDDESDDEPSEYIEKFLLSSEEEDTEIKPSEIVIRNLEISNNLYRGIPVLSEMGYNNKKVVFNTIEWISLLIDTNENLKSISSKTLRKIIIDQFNTYLNNQLDNDDYTEYICTVTFNKSDKKKDQHVDLEHTLQKAKLLGKTLTCVKLLEADTFINCWCKFVETNQFFSNKDIDENINKHRNELTEKNTKTKVVMYDDVVDPIIDKLTIINDEYIHNIPLLYSSVNPRSDGYMFNTDQWISLLISRNYYTNSYNEYMRKKMCTQFDTFLNKQITTSYSDGYICTVTFSDHKKTSELHKLLIKHKLSDESTKQSKLFFADDLIQHWVTFISTYIYKDDQVKNIKETNNNNNNNNNNKRKEIINDNNNNNNNNNKKIKNNKNEYFSTEIISRTEFITKIFTDISDFVEAKIFGSEIQVTWLLKQ